MGMISYLRSKARYWLGTGDLTRRSGGDAEAKRRKLRMLTQGQTAQFKLLPWIDTSLQDTPEARAAYRKMWRDPIVKSQALPQIYTVATLDLTVTPANPTNAVDVDAAEFCRSQTLAMRAGLRGLCEDLFLGGLTDGFALNEKVGHQVRLGEWAGKWAYSRLHPLHPDLYDPEINEYGDLTAVIGRGPNFGKESERFDPGAFTFWQFLSLYGNPLGMSHFAAAYQAYWRRDTAWKLRHSALVNRSGGFLKGTYPQDQEENLRDALLEMLKQARSGGCAVVPNDVVVEVVNLATGSAAEFKDAIDDLNKEIGQSLTFAVLQSFEGDKTGARSMGQVHADTAELPVWLLAEILCGVLNDQVYPDWVEMNFTGFSGFPKASLGGVNEEELAKSLPIDEFWARLGLADVEDLSRRYRRPIGTGANRVSPPQSPTMGMSGGGLPGQGQPAPTSAPAPTTGNALLQAVGGATSLTALQQTYSAGEIDRTAALNAATIIYGLDRASAARLFPPTVSIANKPTEQPKQAPAGGPASRPFDRVAAFADRDVAGPQRDAAKAESLLAESIDAGAKLLTQICRDAFKRLTPGQLPTDNLFTAQELAQLADSIAATRATADLVGRAKLLERLRMAAAGRTANFTDEATDFAAFADVPAIPPMVPEKALEYFTGLYPSLAKLSPEVWAEAVRRTAFTMAAATETKLLADVQRVISTAIEEGGSVLDGTTAIRELMERAGVAPKSSFYAENVYRTNMMDAYNTGATAQMQDPDVVEAFPVWRYDGIRDGRQRPDHERHFGKYFPVSVTFAEVRGDSPWNCRCVPTPVYIDDAKGVKVETSW